MDSLGRAVCVTFSLAILTTRPVHGQTLTWKLAVPRAIEVDSANQVWSSGRVEDSLDFSDGRVLVGSNGGGIWWADENGRAGALSDDWDDPDVKAVERGPDSEFHVYVATAKGLRENRSPGLNRWEVIAPIPDCMIRDLAVMRGARRIVLGCTSGVFWSDIPPPDARRQYVWRKAVGTGASRPVWSLAVKPTHAAWSANQLRPGAPLENANIALVARDPVHRNIFWVAPDGTVRTATQTGRDGWSTPRDITASGAAIPASRVAAVARGGSHLDVFFVGPSGELRTTWWDAGDENWIAHTYTIFGRNTASLGSLTAVAADPRSLDVFWIGSDGALMHAIWTGKWTPPFRVIAADGIAASSSIAVAAVTPTRLDVFWTSPAGNLIVLNAHPIALLGGPPIPDTIESAASVRGGISAVSRAPGKVDVVWVRKDGRLMTAWWNADTSRWEAYALTAPGAARATSSVSLLSRNPLQLDVFWQHADGTMRTNYWNEVSARSFASQTYKPFEPGVRNFAAATAFDEELAFCSVLDDGTTVCREWANDDGAVMVGTLGAPEAPLLKGTFAGGRLTLAAATIAGGDATYSTTSVAVSQYARAAYAVAADPDGRVKAVFRSSDLGTTWAPLPTIITNKLAGLGPCVLESCAGGQGENWNNTIAVSPTNDAHVYLGWVRLYESIDAGASWKQMENGHVHDDIARVRFGDFDRRGVSAYFSTDGGLSATFDAGRTYVSRYNERLTTLECYTTDGIRQTDGTLSASYQVNGLLVAGLQDNGNVWATHGTKWTRFTGGDGGYVTFVREPQVVERQTFNDTPFKRFEWDGSTLLDRGLIGFEPRMTFDIVKGGFATVNDPVEWADSLGRKIYGFAWSGGIIYSFWNAKPFVGDWHFEREIEMPLVDRERLSAGGSSDGRVSFFGTSLGRMFAFNRVSRRVAASPVVFSGLPVGQYGINRIVILSETLGFALLNCWDKCDRNTGYVLRFDGKSWKRLMPTMSTGTPLPVQRYYSIEADWTTTPNTLLLSSDDKVYRSTDLGATWTEQSTGLPRRAHLADIRFVIFPNRTKRFYVSTYGRSVWFADVQ
jgi:hypothetical protein